jgi:aspartate/methionine/tyrosine aminotransferase
MEEAVKVHQFNYVCPPTPLQHGCVEAMDWDISEHVAEYEKRAEYIYQSLKEKYQISKPEGAFYFFVKYPYDGKKFLKDCLAQSLLIVPGESFSKKDTHFRISFATSTSDIEKAVKILNSLV